MPTFMLDTSCMVAAICTWHEHHVRAQEEIERRLKCGEVMVAAAPALVEAYAVLTRLPFPHRLSAEDALSLLEANFMAETRLVALDGKSYQSLLHRAPREGIAGGRVYDAVIMECALKAGSNALLTFNDADFSGLERKMKIVVPGRAT